MRFVDVTEQIEAVEREIGGYETERRETAVKLSAIDLHLEALRAQLRGLERQQRHKTSRSRHLTPAKQAGRHMTAAHEVMRASRHPLSQQEIGEAARIGRGSLTHAMHALVVEKLAEPTGERRGRSMVFRLTPKGRRGKVTRAVPGS